MSKFLINSDFVAVRKGEFVKAHEAAGEFVLDTEKSNLAKGQWEEVASANKIKVSKSLSAAKYAAAVIKELENLKLAEVNKMTQTELVEKLVAAGFEANKTDEEILVDIISEGVKFREAGKLFKQATEKLGLRVSNKDRKEQAAAILDEAEFNPETYDEVAKAAAHLAKEIPDTSERQALTLIKRWAKANEVELPKAPAKNASSGVTVAGVGGVRGKMLQFLLDNKDATDEEIKAKLLELKPKAGENEKQLAASMKRFRHYANFGRLFAGMEVEEVASGSDDSDESEAA